LLPGGAIQFLGGSFFPSVDQRLFTAHRNISITLIFRLRQNASDVNRIETSRNLSVKVWVLKKSFAGK